MMWCTSRPINSCNIVISVHKLYLPSRNIVLLIIHSTEGCLACIKQKTVPILAGVP